MTSFFPIFSQNRRSRVPVEELDLSTHMSEENGGVNEHRIGSDSIPEATETSTNLEEGRIHSNVERSIRGNENANGSSSNDNNSGSPGSLPSSEQNHSQFQILNPQTSNNRIENNDQETINVSNRAQVIVDRRRRLSRRRHSTFLLILLIFLLKLWVDAIATGDSGLLVLCIACTLWISGLLRRQQEMDWTTEVTRANRAEMTEEERMLENMGLSYQAQLSAAIWESRMLAMMGGISEREESTAGVSEDVQNQWGRFEVSTDSIQTKKGSDSSTIHLIPNPDQNQIQGSPSDLKLSCEEDATCSICLCEYEHGDKVVQLPCSHIYHTDCVLSWTRNNVRCPLCNYNLEDCDSDDADGNTNRSETGSPLETV